jgi:hypothetical protein
MRPHCDYRNDVAERNYGSQRRHRTRDRIATGKANVFRFYSGALPFVTKRKKREVIGSPHECLHYSKPADDWRLNSSRVRDSRFAGVHGRQESVAVEAASFGQWADAFSLDETVAGHPGKTSQQSCAKLAHRERHAECP